VIPVLYTVFDGFAAWFTRSMRRALARLVP